LRKLYPSHRAALEAASQSADRPLLPSVNLIDGKARQFDDGLYAALDLACFEGRLPKIPGPVALLRRLWGRAGRGHPAAPYLAAALELAGEPADPADGAAKRRLLRAFEANKAYSRPISFYTWTPALSRCFRCLRFLQTQPLPPGLSALLAANPGLRRQRDQVVAFYS